MVVVTGEPLSPELVINQVKTDSSGCVAAYIGLIRDQSRGKAVLSVEYTDACGGAEARLEEIVNDAGNKWSLNNMAIYHRTGKLKVGDINLVVAVAAAHRQEGFAACRFAVDQFKEKPPTRKRETYLDGTTFEGGH
jgi:molybdopterin synthase catalytic subunit